MQGVSAELDWDAAVAEPVSVTSSGWVETQDGMVLSARPGSVDAALLGARAQGLTGAGELATITFRALRVGDPAIRFARVVARDAANRTLGPSAFSSATEAAIPTHTLLMAPFPNPASGATSLPFALSQTGAVDLAIYSVDGRRVRSLAQGTFAAGSYRFTWAGDDDAHRSVAPGVYFARLVTAGRQFSRTLVHLK